MKIAREDFYHQDNSKTLQQYLEVELLLVPEKISVPECD